GERLLDLRQQLRIHPGQRDNAAFLPRVHDEARPQRAEFDETTEQFGLWRRPGEAADVVADVEQARHAHAYPLLQIPAQRFPGGKIVARPGLAVAADAGAAGAADHIGAFVRALLLLRLARQLAHQQRLHRPRQALRERFAKAVADGVL